MTRVAYIGNFVVPWCTEVHVARALRENGCEVIEVQQEQAYDLAWWHTNRPLDLVLYTRTHNATALGRMWTDFWRSVESVDTVTASFHLDRFWDLERERLIHDGDPLFTTQHVFTADGGNDVRWHKAKINHHWLMPACDRLEAELPGRYNRRMAHDVVFVGSAQYHAEYPQRDELIAFLHERYGRRFAHYGHNGGRPVVRGQQLNDLYASTKVVVGDSCFANAPDHATKADRYWSDRVPETIGRGGYLIHAANPAFPDELYVATHDPGDWDALASGIEMMFDNLWENRDGVRQFARQHVRGNHTYTHRMRELLCTVGLCEQSEEVAA